MFECFVDLWKSVIIVTSLTDIFYAVAHRYVLCIIVTAEDNLSSTRYPGWYSDMEPTVFEQQKRPYLVYVHV
jgi:hypothetical protein